MDVYTKVRDIFSILGTERLIDFFVRIPNYTYASNNSGSAILLISCDQKAYKNLNSAISFSVEFYFWHPSQLYCHQISAIGKFPIADNAKTRHVEK